MIQRRSFLGAILASGLAPAFVRSGVLMPVKEVWVPPVVVDVTMTIQEYMQHARQRLEKQVAIPIGDSYVVFMHPDWTKEWALKADRKHQ